VKTALSLIISLFISRSIASDNRGAGRSFVARRFLQFVLRLGLLLEEVQVLRVSEALLRRVHLLH